MTKSLSDILREFEGEFDELKLHHQDVPCFNDALRIESLKSFLTKAITEVVESVPSEFEGCYQDDCNDYCHTVQIDEIKNWKSEIMK